MAYNGIAYEIKRLAQRVLLVGKPLAKSMHQDVDTSWWRIGGNTTSWMNGIFRLLIYSLIFHVCYNVPQMFLHYIPVSIPHCHVEEYWRALDYSLIQGEHSTILCVRTRLITSTVRGTAFVRDFRTAIFDTSFSWFNSGLFHRKSLRT